MNEQAIFTVIPAGRLADRRQLKVTVFVTPRLSTGKPDGGLVPLHDFEAFSSWPRTLHEARWAFEVDGIGTVDGRPLEDRVDPDPELWEQLFGGTSVGNAAFQRFDRARVHSFPVEEVTKAITHLYQTVARARATEHPPLNSWPLNGLIHDLAPRFGEDTVRRLGSRQARRRHLAELREASDPQRETPDPVHKTTGARFLDLDQVPPNDRPWLSLAAAAAFYDRTEDPWDAKASTAPPPDPVPPEFHSFVARCADYPDLLRHLGLAIDLWIPDDDAIHELTTIRLVGDPAHDPLLSLMKPEQSRPITWAHRTDRFWAPAAARDEHSDVLDGSLALDDRERFLLEQVDPDGAALKIVAWLDGAQRTTTALAESMQRNDDAPSTIEDTSTLPALRSTGFIVARRNRAASLVRQFERSLEHETDHVGERPAHLGTTDVTRGWRLDVFDGNGPEPQWFSLHRRSSRYELVVPAKPAQPLPVGLPTQDEGYLKAASTASQEAEPEADQYLHETLAGWDGWSLAARRPGKVVNETAPEDPTVDPAKKNSARELPRVADAGFPLAAHSTAAPGSLPRLRFGRRYRVRVRAVDLSGQSIPEDQLDRRHERDLESPYQRWEPVPSPAVVPLTEYTEGESLMRMVIRSTLDVPVADYLQQERAAHAPEHQVPESTGIVYREDNARHLAAPLGSVQLAETHGLLDAAFSGDPAARAEQFAIAAKEKGSFFNSPGARVINRHQEPTPLDATAKGQPLGEGEYVVCPGPELELPYLPDPLARGLSLTGLPGDSDATGSPGTRLIRWPGNAQVWHDRQPVLIRIVEGSGAPEFDDQTRTLTVPLPKATVADVRLSSFLDERDAELLRIWWLMQTDPEHPATATDLDHVAKGLNWLISPYSVLTLVHAVEKPLEAPAIELAAGTLRETGATFSLLPGTVRNHAASTGRIDIDAAWEDPVDDVLAAGPSRERKDAHVADFTVTPAEVDAQMWRSNGPPAGPYGPRHEVRHEFGDTRHRYVHYTPTATTRFREYFPPSITDQQELVTSVGTPVTVNVPSSARPDPPLLKYILPTWEWQESPLEIEGAGYAVRRVRTGGGLRLYLDRPWYSSGPDELLGIVLAEQPWITWPVDLGRGMIESGLARELAENWARQVLDHRIEGEPNGIPAVERLTEQIRTEKLPLPGRSGRVDLQRPGDTSTARRLRATSELEKFLLRAQAAIERSSLSDAAVVAAKESAATSAALTAYLPLFTGTGPEARRFTTVWGTDPVFEGEQLPAGPYIHQFPLRTAVAGGLELAEVPGSRVTVVGHQPEFDPERRLWFCDVQVDAGDAYTPFVQLHLGRYQPHSVTGQQLSKTVKADFAQVLPRREATFITTADQRHATVTLAGPVGVPATKAPAIEFARQVSATRHVEAWVERLPANSSSDLDWAVAGDPVPLEVRPDPRFPWRHDYAGVRWSGALALPEVRRGERLRLRVAEYEVLPSDEPPAVVTAVPRQRMARRLVYSDEVELP